MHVALDGGTLHVLFESGGAWRDTAKRSKARPDRILIHVKQRTDTKISGKCVKSGLEVPCYERKRQVVWKEVVQARAHLASTQGTVTGDGQSEGDSGI